MKRRVTQSGRYSKNLMVSGTFRGPSIDKLMSTEETNDRNETDDETGDETPTAEGELTASRAWELWNPDGKHDMSYREIGNLYGVSHSTARRRVEAYQEGRESGIETVKSAPEDFNLKEAIKDDPDDDNPFETTCPACQNMIEKPDEPGAHDCPECGTTLQWSKDEIA